MEYNSGIPHLVRETEGLPGKPVQLKYHHNTYELLTQHRIEPQKAIDERSGYEFSFIPYYSIEGQTPEETLERKAEEQKRRLAWTKLQLYQRPVQFSEANSQQLDSLERHYNVKLPTAVREWYSLDIAPEIMTVRGWGPISIGLTQRGQRKAQAIN